MPKAFAVLVKQKVDKGHGGAGVAVLVPQDVSAAADVACDAAESYNGSDGKPLFKRNMPRRQMGNELDRAERLSYEGQKHKDVKEGKIANALEEAGNIHKRLKGSFVLGVLPRSTRAGSHVVGEAAWQSEDARLAATSKHMSIALKALHSYRGAGLISAEDSLRIACDTSHPAVAVQAVELAIKAGASKEQLLFACERIQHEEAATVAYESAKGIKKAKE